MAEIRPVRRVSRTGKGGVATDDASTTTPRVSIQTSLLLFFFILDRPQGRAASPCTPEISRRKDAQMRPSSGPQRTSAASRHVRISSLAVLGLVPDVVGQLDLPAVAVCQQLLLVVQELLEEGRCRDQPGSALSRASTHCICTHASVVHGSPGVASGLTLGKHVHP